MPAVPVPMVDGVPPTPFLAVDSPLPGEQACRAAPQAATANTMTARHAVLLKLRMLDLRKAVERRPTMRNIGSVHSRLEMATRFPAPRKR